jgi:uncharacterized glyoxalase superfamily protein PhnB
MSDSDTPQAPPPQVWPSLRAHDANALIRFLVDVIGFAEAVVHRDGDLVMHAELRWPLGGGIMLGSVPSQEAVPWAVSPGSAAAYVVCDEIDALYARALAAGATILREPYHTDYGSHDCAIADPEGNRWSFGTYRGHPVS